MGTVTFGKLLPGKVEAVHGSCSVSSFFPPSAFRKSPATAEKRSAALSSEWLDNSGDSDFSRTSLGLCLWSNVARGGLDTLKMLLGIWLSVAKSGSGRRRQWMMALMFSPEHLALAVKSSSQGRQAMKKLPWKNFTQGSAVRCLLLKVLTSSQCSADCVVTEI